MSHSLQLLRLLVLRGQLALFRLLGPKPPRPGADDRGQATTEYALVLLAAALVALLVVAWATSGGGAERIGGLFNAVIDSVIGRV